MTKEELENLWRDERNWSLLHAVYNCPADPRLVVPKRIKWTGWTINVAHNASWFALLGIVLLTLAPVVITIVYISQNLAAVLASIALSLVAVSYVCISLSAKTK